MLPWRPACRHASWACHVTVVPCASPLSPPCPIDADPLTRVLANFRERLAKFGLELHAEKTRLIEFGRFARSNRQARGEGEPESFTFLGFTHYCGINSAGYFTIRRQTARKRLEAKLQQVKQTLRARMHEPVPKVGEWLRRVLNGFYQYHAVPGNWDSLKMFRQRIGRYWRHVLQTAQPTRTTQRGAPDSIIQPLAHSTPAGASLPERAL